MEKEVYKLAEMFIIGFYSHCDINEVGLSFMTENIARIEDHAVK
jgi:hypothetical protein